MKKPQPLMTVYTVSKIFCLILILTATTLYFRRRSAASRYKSVFEAQLLRDSRYEEYVSSESSPTSQRCTHWQCVDVYRCGRTGEKITVYIYPITRFTDDDGNQLNPETSSEYMRMLLWLRKSSFFVDDPQNACLFLPSVDMLGAQHPKIGNILATLPFWRDGSNHLIVNQLQSTPKTGKAMHVSALLTDATFRPNFDISVPLLPPSKLKALNSTDDRLRFSRAWQLAIARWAELPDWAEQEVLSLAKSSAAVTLLEPCTKRRNERCVYTTGSFQQSKDRQTVEYPKALANADFCLLFSGIGVDFALLLTEAASAGCIPVILHNEERSTLPFPERIDWLGVVVNFNAKLRPDIMKHLESFCPLEIRQRREKLVSIYERYMSSPEAIMSTTIDILNERIFSQRHSHLAGAEAIAETSLKRRGFTAVILTYNRLESLRKLIVLLQSVPSLVKVIVVWNNPDVEPPLQIAKSTKPIAVVRSEANKLTNRFFPHKEIETEAILSLDDDILMLTPDELEFGFQVWCENSHRIVGFPSRLHVWDDQTKRWRYESEWLNDISMVLTGAAFYHVDYGRHFFALPSGLRDYVDSKFNCEDILMNFLIANMTGGAAPVKVAPRKKFKPDLPVSPADSLSASMNHMKERSDCINEFTKQFGHMPLGISQCRADPVLFKDNLPLRLKRFNQVGTL